VVISHTNNDASHFFKFWVCSFCANLSFLHPKNQEEFPFSNYTSSCLNQCMLKVLPAIFLLLYSIDLLLIPIPDTSV